MLCIVVHCCHALQCASSVAFIQQHACTVITHHYIHCHTYSYITVTHCHIKNYTPSTYTLGSPSPSTPPCLSQHAQYAGVIRDPSGPREDSGYSSAVNPGLLVTQRLYNYCQKYHSKTKVMAAGLRNKQGGLCVWWRGGGEGRRVWCVWALCMCMYIVYVRRGLTTTITSMYPPTQMRLHWVVLITW